jgi:hypothetical protein
MTQNKYDEAKRMLVEHAKLTLLQLEHVRGDEAVDRFRAAVDLVRTTRVIVPENGEHVYTSRWKEGDTAWVILYDGNKFWPLAQEVVGIAEFGPIVAMKGRFTSATDSLGIAARKANRDCFPTLEAAQAECDRKNDELRKG